MHNLITVSEIADQFGEPPQRVAYIIRKFRIKPEKRIGIIRLFEDKQLAAIKQGLYGIHIHQDRITNPTASTENSSGCCGKCDGSCDGECNHG